MKPVILLTVSLLAVAAVATPAAAQDSSFTELQERGREAMGVNQYTSQHRFDDLPDGGRIELQRDSTDSAGVATIRSHLQDIARSFKEGKFDIPAFVHAREVPGTSAMRERRALIDYEFRPLPGGGEVRITTTDSVAVGAVHEFLAFQRMDHRAPGAEHRH